jgi:nucleoside-diphosphate-sugar epimerase
MHLVIGGDGLIGRAVCAELKDRSILFRFSSRRKGADLYLDLLDCAQTATFPKMPFASPDNDTVFLIAAQTGFAACQHSRESWYANRDAPRAIAQFYRYNFIVFISSDVVDQDEWFTSAYAMQKREVEATITSLFGAIIRPSKVTPERAPELAKLIVDVGLARRPGVTRWA